MKKKVLFVMNNLRCGGAENALVSLLQEFDYSKYEVDLFLFQKEGLFLSKVPNEVNIVEESKEFRYLEGGFISTLISALLNLRFDLFFLRIGIAYLAVSEKNPSIRTQKSWKLLRNILKKNHEKYDVAVGYMENFPNNYVIEKVDATTKIGFIHNDYNDLKLNPSLDNIYFNKFDYVATISNKCVLSLKQNFPNLTSKFIEIPNTVSSSLINKMAEEPIAIETIAPIILTIARLQTQKGIDLALEAAALLVEKKINFTWYFIGDGMERVNLENQVKALNISHCIQFIGLQANPYPYLKACTLYVQPSRFEGKSIAIEEAKILNKPIVVTNYNSVSDQINHLQNGYVVEINLESIANGIATMLSNVNLQKQLQANLAQEMTGNKTNSDVLTQLF
jgi:glycosyltransferase involved in cell wall biosynthesis